MAAPARPSLRPAIAFLSLTALAGLFVSGTSRPPTAAARPEKGRLDDWSVTDLVRHLEVRGLGLRAVPTARNGVIGNNVYLTRSKQPTGELQDLLQNAAKVHRWEGSVFCERQANPDTAEKRVMDWDQECLWVPPFLFFGDPRLREEIRAALADPGTAPPEGGRASGPPGEPPQGAMHMTTSADFSAPGAGQNRKAVPEKGRPVVGPPPSGGPGG